MMPIILYLSAKKCSLIFQEEILNPDYLEILYSKFIDPIESFLKKEFKNFLLQNAIKKYL